MGGPSELLPSVRKDSDKEMLLAANPKTGLVGESNVTAHPRVVVCRVCCCS